MKYKADYTNATYKAHKLLNLFHVTSLPVNLKQILNNLDNVKAITYTQFSKLNQITLSETVNYFGSNFGACILDKINNRFMIAYNDANDIGLQRFTIGHELGHTFLRHHCLLNQSTLNFKSLSLLKPIEEIVENEADCFSRNFLAPIFFKSQYISIENIAQKANVTLKAAKSRMDFLEMDCYNYNEGLLEQKIKSIT